MLVDEKTYELKIWKTSSDIYEAAKDVSFKIGEGISGIVFQVECLYLTGYEQKQI